MNDNDMNDDMNDNDMNDNDMNDNDMNDDMNMSHHDDKNMSHRDIELGISRVNTSQSSKECILCLERCDSREDYMDVLSVNGITQCKCNYTLHHNCYINYSNIYGNMCMICKKHYYQQYNSEVLPDHGISRDGISYDGVTNPNYNQSIVLNLNFNEQEYRTRFNQGRGRGRGRARRGNWNRNRFRDRYYKQCAVCFLVVVGITMYVVNFL